MDLVEYFEIRIDQILNSKDSVEALQYFAFYLGAYDFVKRADLFADEEQKITLELMLKQITEFVSDFN